MVAPTWDDVERAALHCIILHAAVTRVGLGEDREAVLIAAVVALSNIRRELLAKLVGIFTDEETTAMAARGWIPDAAHINALPDPIRQYIHDLERRAGARREP